MLWSLPALFSSCSAREELPRARESQIYIQSTKYPIQGSVDLFCFDMAGPCRLDSYQKVPVVGTAPVYGISTRGPRRLVAVSGLRTAREDWMEIRTYGDLCKKRFSLADDAPTAPLMVSEAVLEDAAAQQVSLSLKPMLVRIRLRSLSADFDARPYAGTPFFNSSIFLGYAVQECLPLGSADGPRPLSWLNTGLPDSLAVMQLPFPEMLLQDGVGAVGKTRIFPGREFYCYPSDELRLTLAGRVGEDVCYYPVPLPGLRAGETCELDITLQRMGSPDPDIPVQPGAILVETQTVPWVREEPRTFEFPSYDES